MANFPDLFNPEYTIKITGLVNIFFLSNKNSLVQQCVHSSLNN